MEAHERKEIEDILRSEFLGWGYGEVKTPVVEFTENLSAGAGQGWKDKLISFFDNDGFAAMRLNGSDFMFHADQTYHHNALAGLVAGLEGRGAGVELRVYGCDPDVAEAKARAGGWTVLAGSMDKPHGLRECIILDDDGYAWVPGKAIKS